MLAKNQIHWRRVLLVTTLLLPGRVDIQGNQISVPEPSLLRLVRRRKPEAQQDKSTVIAWFEWARQERIVLAMSGGDVYTPEDEAVLLQEMMRRYSV